MIHEIRQITSLCTFLFQKVYPMEKRSKQIVYEITKEVIKVSLSLFRTYIQNASK